MRASKTPDEVENLERSRMSAAELSWSLRAVNRASTEVDQALAARLGLRLLDFAAFSHVMSAESDPIGPAELGHRLGITSGSATELVDRLERAEHITRQRAESDRRRVSLIAQEHSIRRALDELSPLFEALDDLATEFNEAEQAAIHRYLRGAKERLARFADDLSS
ncbi:MarR family winged helix-turn-helix transcriptional regulator [Microbacterium sp. DT81.1]|uniref:MarR family winged helix-turn-helix transcriptional regulator n=1 Tax=Microbacterium sp. DT81.1 TaxID=3393413 RepID=UPI003CF1B4BC